VSSYEHKPVLLAETIAQLRPSAGGRYVDGTLGGGGHAAAILGASAPSGWLYGCDRDGAAIEAAQRALAAFEGRFELRRGNFAEMADWIPAGSCDGVLLDLGVSSPQLDTAGRGFSFQQEGPLDMRMDDRQPISAERLVNEAPAEELARIFWEYGDEHQSRRIAREIVRERGERRIGTTTQLAGVIEQVSPRRGKTHPATKVFQALRIAVNDEIGALNRGLHAALTLLKPGGRLAVITFHSLEDRLVKAFGREAARDYAFPGDVDVPELRQPRTPTLRIATRRAITPSEAELKSNPRSRSAQLRVFEKV
jgi:16S rRNA (cytosine1402-N4)-methyltransferase